MNEGKLAGKRVLAMVSNYGVEQDELVSITQSITANSWGIDRIDQLNLPLLQP